MMNESKQAWLFQDLQMAHFNKRRRLLGVFNFLLFPFSKAKGNGCMRHDVKLLIRRSLTFLRSFEKKKKSLFLH